MIFILEVFAPKVRAQANLEHFEIGGLGNVVVCPSVDAFDHGIAIVVCREHDERDIAPYRTLLYKLADLLARKPWHDEVEQNTVDLFSCETLQRFLAGACHDHNIRFLAKLASQLLKVGHAVVYDKYSGIHRDLTACAPASTPSLGAI